MKYFLITLISIFCFTNCGESDPRIAQSPNRTKQDLYTFFNAIRLPIANLEDTHVQLKGFTKKTKAYLESNDAQRRYKVAGMYFELNKDRTKGAWKYEDRFKEGGCQIHVILYPATARESYEKSVGSNKSYGKVTNNYYIYYQIFTANPTSDGLEQEIKTIIETAIEEHQELL